MKLGQLLMIGVSGTSLTDWEKDFIVKNNIGGVTLFGRNVKDAKQVHALCQEIQALRHQLPHKTPLYIAIDMEGGRVARLKAPFTIWPAVRKLGDIDSPTLSFDFANAMGRELHAIGINVDWAPCADILTNPANIVIGDRALGTNSEIVAKHVTAIVRGYLKAGINPCIKHFPGHGNTLLDSHEELPVEELDLARLESTELVPFVKAFRSRTEMLMTSHILFPKIDPKWPVTLSAKFLKEILRDKLRYRGLIITDDLGMKAMTKNYGLSEIPILALQAGADILLYCNEPDTPPLALESLAKALESKRLQMDEIENSYQKILQHKEATLKNPDPLPFAEAQKILGCSEHQKLSEQILAGRKSQNETV